MSVKIWVYYFGSGSGSGGGDGFVRLKLRAGELLRVGHRGADEEGWSSRCEGWKVEDGTIHNTVATDGVDCDGRMSTHTEYTCDVADRHAELNDFGYLVPAWETAESGRRDYAAEAAGY